MVQVDQETPGCVPESDLKDVFRLFDRNKDGFLSRGTPHAGWQAAAWERRWACMHLGSGSWVAA